MHKFIFLLIFGLVANVGQAQDIITLDNEKVIEGEIKKDAFGAIEIQVEKDGSFQTFQLLKNQISSIKYDHFGRRLSIGVFGGFAFFGARNQVVKLTTKNGFSDRYSYSFYNNRPLLGAEIGYSLIPDNELGLIIMSPDHFRFYSYESGGSLEIYYNSFSVLPYYRMFILDHRLSFRGGVSFNAFRFQAGDNYYYGYQSTVRERKQSFPGLYLDVSFALPELKNSFLRFNLSYHQFFGRINVDEVTSTDYNGDTIVLLNKDSFNPSQISFGIVYGRKFR